jgi:hypothetical protein
MMCDSNEIGIKSPQDRILERYSFTTCSVNVFRSVFGS